MRLIDKDALMKELEKEVELADDWKTAHEIVNVVKYFPVVGEDINVPGKWVSVKDRLPEERPSMFDRFYGTDKWSKAMWRTESEKVIVTVRFPDGTESVTTGNLRDGEWRTTVSPVIPHTVTHWMPMPSTKEIEDNAD